MPKPKSSKILPPKAAMISNQTIFQPSTSKGKFNTITD